MLMRVALGIWKDDLDQAIRTYQLLSERWCGVVQWTRNGEVMRCPECKLGCRVSSLLTWARPSAPTSCCQSVGAVLETVLDLDRKRNTYQCKEQGAPTSC